ncbi:hypothetical protein HG442_001845 [Candidatus Gracilibacteria bacterium]|nr:hypothetical protein [Candidatus Gracilibacteria bacterium]
MYTFDAIILEKNILREKQIRIVVLTKEYGKITLWHKKQITGVDIGDIARVVVRRENSMNYIKSIDTKLYLIHKNWNYNSLFSFLSLIKTLRFCVASEESSSQIFSDYECVLRITGDSISLDCCQLLQMRIFKHLGSLNPDFFQEDAILRYMYQKITETPLDRILKAQPLQSHHKEIIEKSNLFSLSTFL